MISICFAGVTGWTAPPILAAIDAADDLTLTSGASRSAAGSGGAVPLAELEGPVEARGAEIGGVRVHSVRLPSFVVSTEVVFGGPGERLIMRHDPGLTPAPYVAGTLLAVRRVAGAVGVRRGL